MDGGLWDAQGGIFAFQGVELAVRPKILEPMAKPKYSNLETLIGD